MMNPITFDELILRLLKEQGLTKLDAERWSMQFGNLIYQSDEKDWNYTKEENLRKLTEWNGNKQKHILKLWKQKTKLKQ